jgi:hypothetical protein
VVEWSVLFGVLAEYLFVFGWVAEWVVVVWVLAESDGLLISPLVPHLDFLSPSPHAHSLALFDHHTPIWV